MKIKIFAMGFVFLFLSSLAWTQPYEITEVDIFSLEKLLSGTEVSVRGVSIGDSMESVLKRFNKKQKDVEKGKKFYILDVEDSFRILFSSDAKVIVSISLSSGFKGNLKGKTAEYFDLLSVGRMKAFVEECFGKPDYVSQKTIGDLELYNTLYSSGFSFRLMTPEMYFSISTKEYILFTAEVLGARKVEKVEKVEEAKEIPRPKMSTVGFRNALWGMSKEQVKKVETSEFMKEEKGGGDFKGLDVLYYKTEVGSLEAVIIYYFAENLLTTARYLITESHSNNNLYIKDFENIRNQLTQKYGSPERDDAIWSNDLYQDDPSEYGTAVSVGHLMYVAEWYPPETIIQLLLRGDNYKIYLWVEYTGEDFREFEKRVREKAKKDIW